ncbi:MAG: bacterial/archaeal transporter family protein [Candidatus Woesearchaeota archaeon]|nr:bacterial/archaeal transporter family protein [Candidatus Woesearchaeota archaeon]
MIPSWLIFALLSAFSASLVAIFGKIGLRDLDSTLATTVRAVVMTIFLLLVVLVQRRFLELKEIVLNSKALFYIILSGVAGALSWLFYFLALKFGKVSQVVPIDRLSVIFALVLAFLIFGEKLSLRAIIGAVFIVVGGILVALG